MSISYRIKSLVVASLTLPLCWSFAAASQAAPDIGGIYQSIPDSQTLPGGLRNEGVLAEIKGLPPQTPEDAAMVDPARICLPIGPFRMMAEPRAKIEIVPTKGTIVILFEDIPHGYWRTVYLTRGHRKDFVPGYHGDSIGHWEDDTLTIDTVGFNTYTWLNANGARHSEALHLVERVRPILGGKYLEYRVTAEDPKALPKPFSYVRYYEKTDTEIAEDNCVIENAPRIPGH